MYEETFSVELEYYIDEFRKLAESYGHELEVNRKEKQVEIICDL